MHDRTHVSRALRVCGITGAVALLATCSLIDFRALDVSSVPGSAFEILSVDTQDVWVRFGTAVIRTDAEQAISVSTREGSVEVDTSWEGNRYSLSPVEGFSQGVRYSLDIVGQVRTDDGRRFDLNTILPFFVGSDGAEPGLASVSVADGATIAGTATVTFVFTRPVDRAAVEEHLSITPRAELLFTWIDDVTVTVAPQERWTNGAIHRWSVTTDITDTRGTMLAQSRSGSFLVQDDVIEPTVVSVLSAVNWDAGAGDDFGITLPLASLTTTDALRIEFSEPMDAQSVRDAFALSPAVSGSIVAVAPEVFAFSPTERWDHAAEYVLTISTQAEDILGNALVVEYRSQFRPTTPALQIGTVAVDGADVTNVTFDNAALVAGVTTDLTWQTASPDGRITAAITFSETIDRAEDQLLLADGVRLRSVFPPDLSNPGIESVAWPSNTVLSITFGGLSPSSATVTNFYEFEFPSGRSQSELQNGVYIEETYTVRLRSSEVP
ncbi:MAG: Ig-like domain-containing protein [Spirochaetales bacterium]|nr:Ig-like domain-containing protein [Spirochaetales bacterium]